MLIKNSYEEWQRRKEQPNLEQLITGWFSTGEQKEDTKLEITTEQPIQIETFQEPQLPPMTQEEMKDVLSKFIIAFLCRLHELSADQTLFNALIAKASQV